MNKTKEATVNLSRYRRIHIGIEPMSLSSAARFLVSSLLVSHGVREDTAAIARLRGKDWLLALGDQLRHLRPDEDTAVGWVKAVIRRNRGLGGILLRDNAMRISSLIEVDTLICVYVSESAQSHIISGIPPLDRYIFIYITKRVLMEARDATNDFICSMELRLGMTEHAYPLAPSIINILLDRTKPELGHPLC